MRSRKGEVVYMNHFEDQHYRKARTLALFSRSGQVLDPERLKNWIFFIPTAG